MHDVNISYWYYSKYAFLYCYMGLVLIAVVACLSFGTFGKKKLYVCVFTIYVLIYTHHV